MDNTVVCIWIRVGDIGSQPEVIICKCSEGLNGVIATEELLVTISFVLGLWGFQYVILKCWKSVDFYLFFESCNTFGYGVNFLGFKNDDHFSTGCWGPLGGRTWISPTNSGPLPTILPNSQPNDWLQEDSFTSGR
jgi:hypothetical protein